MSSILPTWNSFWTARNRAFFLYQSLFNQTFWYQIIWRNKNALIENFCRNMHFKWHKKTCETRKYFVKLWQIHETSASFSSFAFVSLTILQNCKYVFQSCDCMVAPFKTQFLTSTVYSLFISYIRQKKCCVLPL